MSMLVTSETWLRNLHYNFFFFFFFFFKSVCNLFGFSTITITLLGLGFPEVLNINKSFSPSCSHLTYMCTIAQNIDCGYTLEPPPLDFYLIEPFPVHCLLLTFQYLISIQLASQSKDMLASTDEAQKGYFVAITSFTLLSFGVDRRLINWCNSSKLDLSIIENNTIIPSVLSVQAYNRTIFNL